MEEEKKNIDLTVDEADQINGRVNLINIRSRESDTLKTEVGLLRFELSIHIANLVANKGGDKNGKWNFDGRKLVSNGVATPTSNKITTGVKENETDGVDKTESGQ